ncbi:hypothetical protein [Streptomyces acidicola]|nr:hypothetical protein [Streptomyces acidicola]
MLPYAVPSRLDLHVTRFAPPWRVSVPRLLSAHAAPEESVFRP